MSTGEACVVSWSGGKDSTMALLRARRLGYDVRGLFTMFSPDNGTSRSHGLPPELLEAQAAALRLPLHRGAAGWSDYEAEFKRRIATLVEDGIEVVVFGDIFLDDHRAWVERVCAEVGCRAVEPLWGEPTGELARSAVAAGIDARICTVRTELLDADWLGVRLSDPVIGALEGLGIDPCGEHGEYHTVVVAGPQFAHEIVIDGAETRADTDHAHWNIGAWHVCKTDL